MECGNKSMAQMVHELSFMLDDLILYLDTHPYDTEALASYQEYQKLLNQAQMDYNNTIGPLHAKEVDVCNGWAWIDQPWPWEGEC
ncbi:spore coat protein CotJB [Anaerolentibacter hominis]|uniref:spore coat protein CotJB n=1 Tax=Anaerolentibacter hominis TaxID=3079009 RepID=UPI0031B84995